MNDVKTEKHDIELEYDFDEPPQKVWRAISIPEFRESWLPSDALADPEATSVTPGQEVRYRMRDNAPPFLESTVTFTVTRTHQAEPACGSSTSLPTQGSTG